MNERYRRCRFPFELSVATLTDWLSGLGQSSFIRRIVGTRRRPLEVNFVLILSMLEPREARTLYGGSAHVGRLLEPCKWSLAAGMRLSSDDVQDDDGLSCATIRLIARISPYVHAHAMELES
jgi:hypothetical protein